MHRDGISGTGSGCGLGTNEYFRMMLVLLAAVGRLTTYSERKDTKYLVLREKKEKRSEY